MDTFLTTAFLVSWLWVWFFWVMGTTHVIRARGAITFFFMFVVMVAGAALAK